ncbi:MAG: formylglycine-generating enzyme family protein [Crocosphaera sp.]|nr:formylglycine-generating enzyme family protein [Crocosphaera sp.]
MLAQNISDRYQSAEAILNDLNNLDKHQVTSSPTVIQTPSKYTQNQPDLLRNYLQTISFETVQVNTRGQIINRETRQAQCFTEILPGGVKLEMMKIPGGTFMMGTDEVEIERLRNKFNRDWFKRESPQHLVTIQPFFMSKYPITQEQWKAIASETSLKVNDDLDPDCSRFKGNKNPVEQVSWYDCVEFCRVLIPLNPLME